MKRYRKVVKWSEDYNDYKKWNEKYALLWGLLFMIPIIGQISWLCCLLISLQKREVYWEEIHKSNRK